MNSIKVKVNAVRASDRGTNPTTVAAYDDDRHVRIEKVLGYYSLRHHTSIVASGASKLARGGGKDHAVQAEIVLDPSQLNELIAALIARRDEIAQDE